MSCALFGVGLLAAVFTAWAMHAHARDFTGAPRQEFRAVVTLFTGLMVSLTGLGAGAWHWNHAVGGSALLFAGSCVLVLGAVAVHEHARRMTEREDARRRAAAEREAHRAERAEGRMQAIRKRWEAERPDWADRDV